MFLLYISTRYSTQQSFIGYPRILRTEKSVSVCVSEDDELKVTIIPVLSTEMSYIDYCVAVNSERPLYHRCSAQMLIPYSTVKAEDIVRNSVYTHYPEHKKIKDARYKCTNETKDITFKNLHLNTSSFYINVYSVNRRSELSSSFRTVRWEPSYYDLKKCGRKVKIFKTSTTGNHKEHQIPLRYANDLYIEITGKAPLNPTFNSRWYLWFQPCRIPPSKTKYRLSVKQIGTQKSFQCNRQLTRYPVNVCDQNKQSHLPAPGMYKITVMNAGVKELSRVAGNIILSHTSVYYKIFPFHGKYRSRHHSQRRNSKQRGINSTSSRRNLSKKIRLGRKIDVQLHCRNKTISASVYAYKTQWYCFFLRERRDNGIPKRKMKRFIAENVDLCQPSYYNYEMYETERQCTYLPESDSLESKPFNRVTITFKAKLRKEIAYSIEVYFGKRVIDKDRIKTSPFYGFKYISAKQIKTRCRGRNRKMRNINRYSLRNYLYRWWILSGKRLLFSLKCNISIYFLMSACNWSKFS